MKINWIILFILASITSFGKTDLRKKSLSEYYISNAEAIKSISKEDALKTIDSGIIYLSNLKNDSQIGDLYFYKARIYDFYYEYDSSFIFYKKAAPFLIKSSNKIDAAKSYINIGYEHYYRGEYELALFSYNLAEILLENQEDILLKSKVYNNKGLLKKSIGEYYEAILDFQLVIDLLENTEHELNLANAFNNIGIIYWEQKNYQLGINYFEKALKLYYKNNSTPDIASTYVNIGLIFSSKSDTTKAIYYYDQAIDLYSQINNYQEMGLAMINKAVLLDKNKRFEEAEMLFLKSLEFFDKEKYNLGVFIVKCNLSQFYSEKGDKNKAINYALQAISMTEIDKPLNYLSETYLVLASTFTELRDFQKANEYLFNYVQIKDTAFNIEINKEIAELQTKYETDKKDLQLDIYSKQIKINELEIEQSRNYTLIAIFIIILVLISTFIFAILYLQKRRSYMSLVEQNFKLAKSDIEKEKKLLEIKEPEPKLSSQINPETNINDSQKLELLDSLSRIMEVEKIFMNSQLTINELAKLLKTNRNYLSQIINENYNINFNNYLNEFRVREARKLLISEKFDNYTIEGIGQTVGFFNRASFNTAFKKHTGVTPSFFRNNYFTISKLS
ncbi:MAG: tetratricopeptide repeat protein [Bacteroidales bacterium]|nr:tetratricopeptide repeat protein [Bacteroidales bacterium]